MELGEEAVEVAKGFPLSLPLSRSTRYAAERERSELRSELEK